MRLDIIFIISVIVIWVIADIFVRKKLNISKKSASDYKRLSAMQIIYFLAIYSVLFLIVSAFWKSGLEVYVFLLLFSGLFGYRAFKQRQHDQSSKQYVRTMLTSLTYLILFIGLVIIVYPREFDQTFEAVMYSDDDDKGEQVSIEVRGQTWQNLLYGKSFIGEMKTPDGEFLILRYLEEPGETPFIDRLKGTYRQYTLIETSGNRRGKIRIARDFSAFAGSISGNQFAYPAKSADEAADLLSVIFKKELHQLSDKLWEKIHALNVDGSVEVTVDTERQKLIMRVNRLSKEDKKALKDEFGEVLKIKTNWFWGSEAN